MLTPLAFLAFAQLSAALPADSADALRREARAAEARYERLARRLAPITWSAPSGTECDEIVGRFCLTFGPAGYGPTPEEAGRVVDARRDAVEAARRHFAAAPDSRFAAGPLVRLLIADGRPGEAVSAAGAFAHLSADPLWSHLLLALSMHADRRSTEAEEHFRDVLMALESPMRREWLDLRWLLPPRERSRLRALPPELREDYERRFWILSDPLWLTPANESRTEHLARHAQAWLLSEVPVVAGMVRWGDDLTELTVRFGVPSSRRQTAGTMTTASSPVEYWDSAQRKLVPEALSRGIPAAPAPGAEAAMYDPRARTGYAWNGVDRLLELPHQLSRFVRGDAVLLRVDAQAQELPAGRRITGLFAFDSTLTSRRSVVDTVMADAGAPFTLFLEVPHPPAVYGIEALMESDSVALAARARYAPDASLPADRVLLSDVVIARPFHGAQPSSAEDPALTADPDLVVAAGDTVGVFAEVYRPGGMLRVAVSLEPAEGPSVLARLGAWMGRTLGIARPSADPRVAWSAGPEGAVQVIALDLPLPPERRGSFELVVSVSDGLRSSESRRRFLIR